MNLAQTVQGICLFLMLLLIAWGVQRTEEKIDDIRDDIARHKDNNY